MESLKLCENDYRFMCVIWDNEPLASGKLVELCEKGFAKNENTVVTAVVRKEDVVAYASDHFVKQIFGGSLPQFLVAFLGGRKISEEEAEELKKLIDEHK